MMKRCVRKQKALFLSCLLGVPFLTSANNFVCHAYYSSEGPMTLGQDFILNWEWYCSAKTDFTYYFRYSSGGEVIYDTGNLNGAFSSSTSVKGVFKIPANLLKLGENQIEIHFETVERIGLRRINHVDSATLSPVCGKTLNALIRDNKTINIERTGIVRDESGSRLTNETYSFSGVNMTMDGGVSRGIKLSSTQLTYTNSFYPNGPKATGEAELRILDHLDDWHIGTRYAGYISVPLRMQKIMGINEMEMFNLQSKNQLVLSKTNLRMSAYEKGMDLSNSILTREIFLPIATGHENDTYRFQIYFRMKSPSQDVFRIDRNVTCSNLTFGSCDTASYCVEMGGLNA